MDKVIVHYKTNISRNNTFEVGTNTRVSEVIDMYMQLAGLKDGRMLEYRFSINGYQITADNMKASIKEFLYQEEAYIVHCVKLGAE